MREFLFRAKLTRSREWIYGGINQNGDIVANGIAWDIDRDTVGQYIGVDNKNGTKIFEGDIINFLGTIGEIRYYGNGFVLVTEHYIEDSIYGRSSAYGIEVVGNIYDNPELVISRTTQTF